MLAYLALLVFLIGIALLWRSNQSRKASGLPYGRLVYSDTSRWLSQEEPLYDPDSGLTGKPDYVIQNGREIIPVEVKTSRQPSAPYPGHIFQLAAYCLLIERIYGVRPPYGVLHYSAHPQSGQSFQVDYTSKLEREVIHLLAEMRQQSKRHDVPRSHQSVVRCKACGFSDICNQKLE
jgi:CRISPR-associated exonuclease Cas4